ncbi:Snf7-domain-containing protein [Protomyces lactucae-debilis]|uniref:Vacuolar-sorting protein SNF7 n=1 Tax=Protomyces lactucae-debilis TaxID=2754530 RepID=A0A1Y2FQY3_PROLT|nr:Snf7-domain-containing protein [Protomyces lactucae-debilis]ORY86410.1 Snf7-domain-containing protein [Protomyces lactucae-debilis]
MWGVFGGGAKRADEPKDAIVKLQSSLNLLEKRQAYLTKQADEQEVLAKKNMHNKRVAMAALRRKKQYETEADKLEDTKRTVETQLYSIQNANVQHETLMAMKQGAAAMKNIHKGMNIDKVDKVMDDIQDQLDISNEISGVLGGRIGATNAEDEDELLAELESMQQEDIEQKLLQGGSVPVQPVSSKVPATKVAATEEEEDEEAEFAKLQAQFAM